ncbi:MAG: hypothetical protein ABI625_08795 [bacterium]
MPVTLRLLGSVSVQKDGQPLAGKAAQRRRVGLLAILALSPGRAATRDRIVGLLWADSSPDAARRNLSEAVYNLRRSLGDDILESTGDQLVLATNGIEADVDAFRSAIAGDDWKAAVTAYPGPLLDGWYIPDAPELERWIDDQRTLFAANYRKAIEQLAESARRGGDVLSEVQWRRLLARTDLYSSGMALGLADALERAGEPAEASQSLLSHCELLRDELEVEPGDAVKEALARLRLSTRPSAARTPPVRTASPRQSPVAMVSATSAPMALTPLLAVADSGTAGPHRNWWRFAMLAVAAVGIVVVAAAWYRRPLTTMRDPNSIAVLYFDDHSPPPGIGYLADGITEQLIHDLASVSAFRVVSRNGVKSFRGQPPLIDSLSRMLDVGSIIEGSVQRSGDSIRVTAQLIDANTGKHVSSTVHQRPMTELFQLEVDVASAVAGALQKQVGREIRLSRMGSGAHNAEARSDVLRAQAIRDEVLETTATEHPNDIRTLIAELWRADTLLANAERLDPRWNRPSIDRVWIRYYAGRAQFATERLAALDSAAGMANRLLLREPTNPELLALRGASTWYQIMAKINDRPDSSTIHAAERDLRSAIEKDSSLAFAWSSLSALLLRKAAYAEADLAARKALAADAYLSGAEDLMWRLFAAAYVVGDLRAAGEWCHRGQVLYPRNWHLLECDLTLMKKESSRNDARAWQLVTRLDRLDPEPQAVAAGHPYSPIYRRMIAASISARAGDRARAEREIKWAQRATERDSVLAQDLLEDEAFVLAQLGDDVEATRLLRELIRHRPGVEPVVRRDTVFGRLLGANAPASPQTTRSRKR